MSKEQFMDIIYNTNTISFTCACGTDCAITKHEPDTILSATFCRGCDEQYYIRWHEGVLRKGQMGTKQGNTSWLRGVVLGLDDGLVTTLVTIMTVSSIAGAHLFTTMIGVVLASAISMALGGYASARTSQDKNPITEGLQTGGAFLVGGMAPLLPVALHLPAVQWWSYGATALVSLGFGWLKVRYGEQAGASWLKSALFFLVIVTAGTLAGVVIGLLLPG
jgi:hypothetical protein